VPPDDPLAADPARVGECAQALGLGSVGAVVSASILGHVHLPRMQSAPAVPVTSDSTSQSITMVRDDCPVAKSNRRTLHLGSDGQVSRGSRKRANTSYRPPRALSHSVSFRSPMPTISPPWWVTWTLTVSSGRTPRVCTVTVADFGPAIGMPVERAT